MASATALAVAIGRSWLAAAAVAVVLLGSAPPARAADEVYIWRDANGAVRFSAVEPASVRPEPPRQSEITVRPMAEAVVVTEVKAPRSY